MVHPRSLSQLDMRISKATEASDMTEESAAIHKIPWEEKVFRYNNWIECRRRLRTILFSFQSPLPAPAERKKTRGQQHC
jgi:hypothetical protein